MSNIWLRRKIRSLSLTGGRIHHSPVCLDSLSYHQPKVALSVATAKIKSIVCHREPLLAKSSQYIYIGKRYLKLAASAVGCGCFRIGSFNPRC